MTPGELDRIENRVADSMSTIELRDCGRALSKSLRTAWAERDKLNVLLDERNDNTDALLFDHAMREASLLEERAARPDAATSVKVKTVIEKLHDFCAVYSVGGNDLLLEAREALRLLERKP